MKKTDGIVGFDDLPARFNPGVLSQFLGISQTSAYQLTKVRGFPHLQVGKRIVIFKEHFIVWLEKNYRF